VRNGQPIRDIYHRTLVAMIFNGLHLHLLTLGGARVLLVIRSEHLPCHKEECEDIKGVITIIKSKKYRQHNDQKKKDKQRSTITHKTKDRVTLKTESKLRCSERVNSSCSSRGTVVLPYLQTL
jgi:hypothetical protein